MIYYNIPEIRKYIKVKEPEDFRKFRDVSATEMYMDVKSVYYAAQCGVGAKLKTLANLAK